MLRREDFYMIKQLREKGVRIVDIADELRCSERTVRRKLQQDKPSAGRRKPRGSKLDRYKTDINAMLYAEKIWNAEVIFRRLNQQGYDGSISLVRNYITPLRAALRSRKTVRFETKPGAQLQHDWGEVSAIVADKRCTVNIAVNALGYSRRFHVYGSPSQDAEHTYESLVKAFNYFGGVPKQVLVDNQKAAVLHHHPGGHVVFNEGFLALAHHYGFEAKACRPRRARTKGKVERMVGYVKHNFFAEHQSFDSFSHLNQLLEQWLNDVADMRLLRQFRQTPLYRFKVEQEALQALPQSDFDTRYYDVRIVAWDAYIDVRGHRYSVPAEYCAQQVIIRISMDNELSVYSIEDELIAQHRLQQGAERWHTIAEHHQALWNAPELAVQTRDLRRYEEAASCN